MQNKRGESEKDREKIKAALLKKAVGYDYEEREAIVSASGRAEKAKIITKHEPPDLNAIKQIDAMMRRGEW